MKKILVCFSILSFSFSSFAQSVIFESRYEKLPFNIRIDNSGIYSIASFNVEKDGIYFSSFIDKTIYKYEAGKRFSVAHQKYVYKDVPALFKKNSLPIDDLSNNTFTFQKNYFNGNSLLINTGGNITGSYGEEIKVIVSNRNELIIQSNIENANKKITLNFNSDLVCADLIGIDKNGKIFLIVEKYISEIPLKVERNVYTLSKNGEVLSRLILPKVKYIYTIADLQIDEDGNLYHLFSSKEEIKIIKWTFLTEKHYEVINYPSEYNYELHFNNFVPSLEPQAEIHVFEKSNAKASRALALKIAETYIVHQYTCKIGNLAQNPITAPDGDVVQTPGWLISGVNARIPYKWGGFNTVTGFDAGLSSGKYAGDINTNGVSSYAIGVDCSGYVSRCWQLSYHSSTSEMPGITTQYSSWDKLKPGDAIHRVGHVRLFIQRNTNGTLRVAESAGRNWDVSYWSFAASDLTTYTPRYYNQMEDNFNFHQPDLLSAKIISDSLFQLKWKCTTDSIIGYRVYHSTNGNNWNQVLNESKCQTTETTIALKSDVNFFRVSSVKKDNYLTESNWSNVLGVNSFQSKKKALVVDGFERDEGSWRGPGHAFVAKYSRILGSLNFEVVSIKNSELLNGNFQLSDYNYVFWILGDESTVNETFNSAEQQLIKNYLTNGGNLFLSGSEVGWDLDNKGSSQDKSFYNDYLKSRFVSDNAGVLVVNGIGNSSLTDCSFYFGQTYYEDYPDEIEPYGGSKLCIKYSNGKGAGIEFSGYFGNSNVKGSLIYLAFPLESTADDASFNSVIIKSIAFFDSDKLTSVENDPITHEFVLEQNYPNPFNPSTVISYRLSVAGFIELKVYDILGREIETLVSEFQQAGFYKTQFTISHLAGRKSEQVNSQLPSGVYFYRLQAGNYSETKKMILLR
jgi:hypothetical protein